MRLDKNPFFRKEIIPWYDSNLVCSITIVICLCALVFSLVGIKVALTNIEYADFAWLPFCIVFFSSIVLVKVLLKLIKRRQNF